MKLKKISIMTLAALYATGIGTLVANPLTEKPMEKDVDQKLIGIKLTQEQIEQYKNKPAHPAVSLASRPGQIGMNVHRAVNGGSNKAPFTWEKDIDGKHTYIIQLMDAPVSLYQGERPEFAATSPRSHQPAMRASERFGAIDVKSKTVKNYQAFLTRSQDETASQIKRVAPEAEIKRRFNVALNGMTMVLSQEQAADVAKLPNVKAVTRAKEYQLFTDVGPKHIGADMIWQGTGVPDGVAMRGEGIIAGIIDTGINSDHPSFAAVSADGYKHVNPLGEGNYLGDCQEYPLMCNSKLIGVRSYEMITDSYKDPIFQPDKPEWEVDYKRPPNGEDYNGHGSHTASTVAGNVLHNVPFKLSGNTEKSDGFDTSLVFPEISGVAPRANIIAYQVCYPGGGTYGETYGGCPGDALVAAIEDAIIDGVDVINFSIGGLESLPWYDAVEMAFLGAREAGISVAASAGNWGRYGPGYIDHVSPWLTSVAASTHGRQIEPVEGTLTFAGENALSEMAGYAVTGNITGNLVDAAAHSDPLCLEPFPAGIFNSDDIVICKRGENGRVQKGVNVAAGGAGGVILYNAVSWDDGTGANSLNLNPFPIPGMHIDYDSGQKLVEWVANTANPKATIIAGKITTTEREADVLADFSSRGPSNTNPNVMVPNVSAPGVDVFAAYSDEMPFNLYPSPSDYVAISGTSMSGPHVAGALALLTQAHPQWTPAMIQSALMTTAVLGKSPTYDNPPKLVDATFYDMGSGVINVARAVKAGLVMDENADNYRAANPTEGGDVTALNVPYLVNAECKSSCTWMRTFTATTDGEWNVSATEMTAEGAPFLELSVYPQKIKLKVGEQQSLMVTAKILDVASVNANSSFNEVFGKIDLKPTDASLPDQYLPVMARFTGSSLPEMVSGQIHRDTGTMLTPKLMTKEISELTVKVSGLTAGTVTEHKLSAAYADFKKPETLENNPGISVHFFDVPEGTRRIVWEEVSADNAASTSFDIGMDLNSNGKVEWYDEAICYSYTDVNDYCAINDPTPGRYWVMLGNFKRPWGDEIDTKDSIKASLAIISDSDTKKLSVTGPASTNGLDPYQLQMNWTLDEVKAGERFYGLIELGNGTENVGNIGKMAVHLVHTGDDVTITTSQQQAKEGDIVQVNMVMAPNMLGLERDVNIALTLPEGMQLLPDTLSATSNNQDLKAGLSVASQQITLNAMQKASNEQKRQYLFTTSDTDESCRIPIGSNPYYLDLFTEAGIQSEPGIAGRVNDTVTVPLSLFGIDRIPLYNNPEEYSHRDTLSISPGGFIQLDQLPLFWPAHYPMEEQYFPDTVIAPLWRGDGFTVPDYNMDTESFDGVSLAVTNDRRYLIVEWDNMRQEFAFGINFDPDPAARYSFELLASTELNFAPGEHEFIFAYDKLTGNKAHLGSIGLHGYYGPRGSFAPANGYIGDGFAFNDLDKKIAEGLVVCANYAGPEQSAIEVSFSARVGAKAVGQVLPIVATSEYTGSNKTTTTSTVKVPSNLAIGALRDMTVAENTSISFEVLVQDKENTANGIQVTGEHITVVVNGNQVTITPEKDWHGETTVTVKAFDMVYQNDMVQTSFNLVVSSDGVEPTPTTPPTPPTPPVEDSKDSSGGSLGWFVILMLGLMALSRQKWNVNK
ncbi:S8 family serine peptidase [Shewanella baltica]|uniref:S8 family serine peptidase n=1 Tax=Shewanella baltica TaxID=62322 RepID=UPI000D1ADB31|nr:S8 family serine peptidase [Shewanella baltica]AVT47464.1 serine protease [Shewanella baltica]MCS6113864.1 S8 family serine peptidase [Shewanella baltica]MCS6159688.1 S8 family serine peptidase [Shewanella baltica]UVW65862.1 S8 family serine peptidase [Shewanella baltica]